MMNKEDLWIVTYMTMLWKSGNSNTAKLAANQAIKDYDKTFSK